jgi:hypothetical protein
MASADGCVPLVEGCVSSMDGCGVSMDGCVPAEGSAHVSIDVVQAATVSTQPSREALGAWLWNAARPVLQSTVESADAADQVLR